MPSFAFLIWACTKSTPDTDSTSPEAGTGSPVDSARPGETEDTHTERLDTVDTASPCTADCDDDGYTTEDGDCDDDDDAVHPEAEETPYDDIDQDCDGSDLTDVDGDGWTYDLDCDDEDGAIHPEQTEDGLNEVDDDCDGYIDLDGRSEWDSDVVALGDDRAYTGTRLAQWPFAFGDDYDGDGYADLIVTAHEVGYVIPTGGDGEHWAAKDAVATLLVDDEDSGPWGPIYPGSGHAVPDVDGDGLAEVAFTISVGGRGQTGGVGIWGSQQISGGASLNGAAADIALLSDTDFQGPDVASGDLDGDGVTEHYIAEGFHDGHTGRVVVLSHDDLSVGLEVDLDDIGQQLELSDSEDFGQYIWPVGDLDGDGYESLAVQDWYGMWLIDGDALPGDTDVPEADWDFTFVDGVESDGVLTPGDIDDDGFDDVIMLIDRRLEVFLDLGTGGVRNLSASSASVYLSTEGEDIDQVTGPVRLRDGQVDVVVSASDGEKDLFFIGLEELPVKGELDLAGWPHGIGGSGTALCAVGSASDLPNLTHADLDNDGDDELACGNERLTLDLAPGDAYYDAGLYEGGIVSIFVNPL